ncbi:ABC transporter ATP-binding protein [Bordetella holmesii]|uniref:ABC transporter, ATP-binding protein n=1 Tax=Bordetella holmesii CDC-H585-BH TaxID=1331206 RepID=A0A158M3K9_9BORD|nr:ABC transporter ATP-binding protein [Bordetella holmesii]AMD49811.1 multidrug ABC transporter ATPase [Bordetella holmesii F627]AOB36812.1 multidrug ABC transporter ATP-binding protein [Bordetella holmesii]AUL20778.1 multidrug ABC transporter ATP-binding protein [Bordetella holmesii]AUL24102.1 multidrug ABC transporter ATP-binding protein [Bordetella holmesii]AUL27429.1 multidrug ABC transporter ATP-binding protein [Bordetella holmesii]
MARSHQERRGQTFRNVLVFTLRRWVKQSWRLSVVAAMALLSAGADVLTPMYAGRLVDALVSGSPGEQAVWHAALTAFWMLVALGGGGTLLRQIAFRNIIPFTLTLMHGMACDAFHRVQRLSSDWHANSFAGSTVRKITRGIWAVDLLNDTLLTALLPSVVMLVGATVLLGVSWPLMGLVVGLGALLYIGVAVVMALRYVAPAARLSNAWDTRMGGALADAVSCNAVVKAFGAESREETRFEGVLAKWRARTRRSWLRVTLNGGLQGVMMTAMQAAMLGVSLYLWINEKASVGDITFAMTMFFVLKGYLREVGMNLRNLQRSINDMEELVMLDTQPLGVEDRQGTRAIKVADGEIRFEHVTFRYGAQQKPLYEDFSIRIAPGERIGLVGHSGSGKTTFIKLIQRLHDLDSGRITIDGQDIALVRQASLRRQIAIVQQEPILFHRTLAENIAYARPDASRAEVEEAARQASAHDFIMALPKGYETLVGERGVKLSGGERQRVAIARAFLADAPILILDEATSSLDSESEVLIQAVMTRLMQGRTTLVVAHRLSTVRALDRLLVMDHGKVVEAGSHEALIRREGGIYRRLFERQALALTEGLDEALPRG